MKDNHRKIMIEIEGILLTVIVLMAVASYIWYLTGTALTLPELVEKNGPGLKLSEDRYYEIYSGRDYELFWNYVESEKPDAKGRLCKDIYLNDISDFESWCVTPPENVVSVTDTFNGIFDGDGHTIYGLYSDWGYGLVRYNRGTVKGIVMKDSLIVGGDSSAGICRQNDGEIGDCLIYGELENRGGKGNNISGICSLNQGNIENCGFLGDMGLREGMVRNPDRAGICLKNKGEVRNCYNFMILPEELKGRKRDNYAISDGGEINCYVAENSNWDNSPDGQILALTEEERFRIRNFLENGLYEYYYPSSNLADSPGIFLWERADSALTEEAAGIFDRDEELCKAAIDKIFLQDELIARIICRISRRREVGLHELSFEVSQEDEGFILDIRSKNSVLRIRKIPWKYRQSNQFLWQLCTEALQEETVDSWEHGTYRICHPDKTWKRPERIILYRTRQDKAGLFYIVEDAVYQVMLPEDSEIQAWLFRAKEYLEDAYLTGSGEAKNSFTCLWEIAFQEICHGKAAAVGTIWRDDIIGKDIYAMASKGRLELLSSEEVINVMEHFTIANGNDVYAVKTFRDIEQLTGLKSLTIQGSYSMEQNGYVPVEPDIRGWKLPEITSIRLSSCKLYDERWLKEFPALKSLRMEFCGLEDISFVAELEGLTELALEGNLIEDITPLSGLTELKELSLWNNNISDISPLKDMMKLQRVDISCNMVSDLSPLSDKGELLELRAYENLIQDIFPLTGLTGLQYLELDNNQIDDFAPIQGMENLLYLSVMGNPGDIAWKEEREHGEKENKY